MDEIQNTIDKIKNNINKRYGGNKSNKQDDGNKDELIEILLDNKNITPKPIYFNFQETETIKQIDQIDSIINYFDENKTKEVNIEVENYLNERKLNAKNENVENLNKNLKLVYNENINTKDEIEILEKYDEIILNETKTINLLNVPNLLYNDENEKIIIENNNKIYEKLLQNEENSYRNRSMETLNIFKKNKDVNVSTINKKNKKVQTNLYKLHKISLRNSMSISEQLHEEFIKCRNKKLKKFINESKDYLSIDEKIILNKNMWIQVDKNVAENKYATGISKSFYKSKKNNTSLFNHLFSTKNITRSISNKSKTFRTKRLNKTKTMKFLTNSFSEYEYFIESIIKKKKEETNLIEKRNEELENDKMFWVINNKKKKINDKSFILLLKNIEKYIVQNIYSYQQLIYKNIKLDYLNEPLNNDIKIFDGENYDPLSNLNVNYKKKKKKLEIKIRKNFRKIVNFQEIKKILLKNYEKINRKENINGNLIKDKINSEDKINKNFLNMPRKKKKIIKKKILIRKLKNKITKKARNRKMTNDTLTHVECVENKKNNENVDNKKKKHINKLIESNKISDIILNKENNDVKIKKLNTLIMDDVLKKSVNVENIDIAAKNDTEKKKLKNHLNKKKKFSAIKGNKIKLKNKIKEKTYEYNNFYINEIYKKNIENNLMSAKKKKEYIKNISITKLFNFHYNKLEKVVTSIDINNFYKDYITASYSNTVDSFSFKNSKGNIAIFNYINPTYPLKFYNVNSNVMKIKYANNQNIIAAILSNGQVYIYDIRTNNMNPIFKSVSIKNYYENSFEPIYDICFKYNFNDNEINDIFYTVHEDGCVYEWSIGKELKNKQILYLKNKKNDLYLDLSSVFESKNFLNKSLNSSLTCIDIDNYVHHDENFIINNIKEKNNEDINNNENINNNNNNNINNINDENIKKDMLNHYKNVTQNIINKKNKQTHFYYYIGTKNGIIYRCNTCYEKLYLNYYFAHFGSVNKIKINQFDHNIFLSCGEDSTIKLWNKYLPQQITTFKSKNSYYSINDILWMPNNSTSFFSCSDDGRIELWDFDFFSQDPLIIFYPNNLISAKMKSLKLFHKNDILLCGDNCANVFMIKIKNLLDLNIDEYEQKMKITNCLKYLDTYDYF